MTTQATDRTPQVVAQILDGKALAASIKAELTERVAALAAQSISPGLGTVLVGDDPGSKAYVAGKHRDCAEVGIASIRVELPASVSQAELDAEIEQLNADPACTGYIVQLPLPRGLDENRALGLIDPDKDADGLHPVNLGKLVLGSGRRRRVRHEASSSCSGTMAPVDGYEVCIVGRGTTVGRPLGPLRATRKSENSHCDFVPQERST